MSHIAFESVVWKEGKHYVAQCLNVDVSSFGRTKKQALEHLREAVGLYFEGTRLRKFTVVKEPSIARLKFQNV